MTLTEEEAKTRRCQEAFPAAPGLSEGGHQEGPFVSTSSFSPAPYGAGSYATSYSPATGGAPLHCLASRCMAWRWRGHTHDGTHTGFCGKAHR